MAPLKRGLFIGCLEGVFRMKQNKYQGIILSLLFIVLVYFFTRNYYSVFFWIILVLLLFLAFLKEENRLFTWVNISFFGGNIFLIYLDKFIEGIDVEPFIRVIMNQILFIIPILSMCYVIIKFNKKISFFFKKMKQLDIRNFLYIIFTLIAVGFTLIVIRNDIELNLKLFLALFSFAFVHAILQEVLWRGILLTQLINITNEKPAILFSSIGFALNTTIFGFSFAVFMLYLSLGFLFAFLTTKYNSILPSIIVHSLILLFIFLNGWLRLPI